MESGNQKTYIIVCNIANKQHFCAVCFFVNILKILLFRFDVGLIG